MVFEQTYSVKIKVKGKSTMHMEIFENMLSALAKTYEDKANVEVTVQDSKGKALSYGNGFSFQPYMNGIPKN